MNEFTYIREQHGEDETFINKVNSKDVIVTYYDCEEDEWIIYNSDFPVMMDDYTESHPYVKFKELTEEEVFLLTL